MRKISSTISACNHYLGENPILAWLIFYAYSFCIAWPLVEQSWFGLALWIAALPLILLGYYQCQKQQEVTKLRKAEKYLSDHHRQVIDAVLLPFQLDLFEEIFLPSLRMAKNHFVVNIMEEDQSETESFDQLINTLCSTLNRLNQLAALDMEYQHYKQRAIAVTVFTFYRTLFQHLNQQANTNESPEKLNTHRLIQRMPYKLFLYMGADYYRLFEFHHAILGNVDSLHLNIDLIGWLKVVCKEIKPVTKQKKKLTKAIEKKSKISTERTLSPPLEKAEQKLIINQEKTINPFKQWLKKRLQSDQPEYKINHGDYVYASSLLFGEESIFISDELLADYEVKKSKAAVDIREALLNLTCNHSCHYILEQEGQEAKHVYRIDDLSHNQHPDKTILIREVKHGNKDNA